MDPRSSDPAAPRPHPSTASASRAARPSRRTVLGAATLAAAAPAARGRAALPSRPPEGPVLVGSANALAGMRLVWDDFASGSDPLDTVIEVVKVVEADPTDHSVGLGGLPNEDGVVQLDAACMHGPTHNGGAVAAIENILHPSEVARLVMERTDHCLLVGRGAYEFARMHGHPHQELLTDEARRIWLRWREGMSEQDDRLPAPAKPEKDGDDENASIWSPGGERITGTIHCSGRAVSGDLACTTTTSGLSYKIPGRVGDSPILGAGLYLDQEAGSAGSTGRGEAAILANGSSAIVHELRGGAHPLDAGMEVLRRIVRQVQRQARWQPGLLREDGKPSFGIHFYVLAADGRWAGVTLQDGGRFAVADADGGPRHEPLEVLLD